MSTNKMVLGMMAKASCSKRLLDRSKSPPPPPQPGKPGLTFSDAWLCGDNELGDNRDDEPVQPAVESVADANKDGDLTLDSKLHCRSTTTRTGMLGRPVDGEEEKGGKEQRQVISIQWRVKKPQVLSWFCLSSRSEGQNTPCNLALWLLRQLSTKSKEQLSKLK